MLMHEALNEAKDESLDDARRRALAEIGQDEVLRAQLFARVMRHRAAVDRLWEPGPESFPEIELAGTARIGQIRAATQLTDARRLLDVLVGTFALLEAGVMFQPTTELLLSLTRNCSDRVAVEVERRVLTRLATLGTTDARRLLEAAIPEVETDLDPELTRQRLEDARRDRGVWISPMPDGMCQVGASLDVLTGRRWSLDFEELARAQKVLDHRDGRERTQAQRRADVFAQLPSRLLALIQSVQQGRTDELLALARLDPEAAASLQELIASTTDLSAEHPSSPPSALATDPAAPLVPATDPAAPLVPATEPAAPLVPATEPAAPLVPATDGRDLTDDPGQPSIQDLTFACLRLLVRDPRVIDVHIPMTTLLELDNRSGWVEGLGAVSAQLTRMLVPVAGLRRIYINPDTGVPIGLDSTVTPAPDPAATSQARDRLLGLLGPAVVTHHAQSQHDPSSALARFVAIRDQHCTGIGCSQQTARCDLDHELRWPDGPTAAWNLSSKSKRCHRAKHNGWQVNRDDAGTSTWTSPLGHSYTRPGVWQAPPPVPHNVILPEPQPAPKPPDYPPPRDLPLWPEQR